MLKGESWDDLWADIDFRSNIIEILDLAHIKAEWLITRQINLIPQLLLSYANHSQEYMGDWATWEMPSTQISDATVDTAELQAFSSLLFTDIHGIAIELFPLSASSYYRFMDLMEAMESMGGAGFHEAYDLNPLYARLVNEALALFELSPCQVSASLSIELLLYDWIEENGARLYMPGWLHQLCNPTIEYKVNSKPLPKGENPHHALIAAMWDGQQTLRDAIEDVNALPYPVLRSILASRERMINDITKKRDGKDELFPDSIDYESLEKEFMENWFLPTEIPEGAIASRKLVQ